MDPDMAPGDVTVVRVGAVQDMLICMALAAGHISDPNMALDVGPPDPR